jgi:outer membrane protein OmpA-like peptidoglycan-associated protein
VESHGEKNLLVPTGDDVDMPRNRRVEVTVR